jgi:TolB-like protein/DNA-binding SARP family transcriptional activator
MDTEITPLLTLRLLGGLEVRTADGRDVTPPGRKIRALLACLALPSGGAGWPRERLVGLLWGDRDEEQARGSLREALVKLRRYMGEPSPLQASREAIALDPSVISIDAIEFARLANAGELEHAAELFRGELLEGLSLPDGGFQDWLLVERTRLHDLAIDVLSRLLASQDGEPAVRTAQRLLQLDPAHEETHRRLIRLYAATGDRSQAFRQYQVCRDSLQRELGVAPSLETEALYRQIRDESLPRSRKGESVPSPPVDRQPLKIQSAALEGIAPAARSPRPSRRSITAAAVAACVVLALVAVAALRWHWTVGRPSVVTAPAIAVLPFDNLSGDPGNGRLADGITADIITDLSRYSDFAVIARESSEAYKSKPVDVRQIGRDLNVSHILEGSFQREGDQVRINVQLVDAATGVRVWSERYDRPAGEVFAIQSELADRIANSLGGSGGQVGGSGLAAAKRKRPNDLGAYELYLLGRDKMIKGLTLQNQLAAEGLLERSIQIDPAFARAHAVLAWTYAWRATLESDTAKLTQQMLDEARRAVDLDPMDADAHQALGYAHGLDGELKQAEIEFDEALHLNPNAFDILADYSCWAHSFGRAKQGAEAADRAMRLNPNYPMWAVDCFRLGLVVVGRYEDVLRNQLHQPEDKWNQDGYVITAGSLAELGRLDEAKALVDRGMKKYAGLLSIEKFALNRGWPTSARPLMTALMRKAGFPPCASDEDLSDVAKPERLPECVKGAIVNDVPSQPSLLMH